MNEKQMADGAQTKKSKRDSLHAAISDNRVADRVMAHRANHESEVLSALSSQFLESAQLATPATVLLENPTVREILADADPVEVAATYAAMLLDPRLQANCVRLEALVCIAIACGFGTTLPRQAELAKCFNELSNGTIGRLEDPAEDLFVSLVTTPIGDCGVLEGCWESGTFYLQRTINIIETIPPEGNLVALRQSATALLRLSEAICKRANLSRYSIGETRPRQNVPSEWCRKANRNLVMFGHEDLAMLGIEKEHLAPFRFDAEFWNKSLDNRLHQAPLHRYPIVESGDALVLVMPSTISYAIRSFCIETLLTLGYRDSLCGGMASEFASLFSNASLLGSIDRAPVFFQNYRGSHIAECTTSIDAGRYIHFLFFLDNLEDYESTGLGGFNSVRAGQVDLLEQRVREAFRMAKSKHDYREGLTLLVHCGLGRGFAIPEPSTCDESWAVQAVTASDLNTLSNKQNFSALKLWKILKGADRIEQQGVKVRTDNLLNLVAWADANSGHMVPHDTPKAFRKREGVMHVAPDFVLDLRHRVAVERDVHSCKRIDGTLSVVSRISDSYFPEDDEAPVYSTHDISKEDGMPLLYKGRKRLWWCHIPPCVNARRYHQFWAMMKAWLARIVPELESMLDRDLADCVLLIVEFTDSEIESESSSHQSRQDIMSTIKLDVRPDDDTVFICVGDAFNQGLAQPINVSERVLVNAICRGFSILAGADLSNVQLSLLESRIVDSDFARHMHLFQPASFRDRDFDDLKTKLITVDASDVAELRTGLAFRVESRDSGRSSIRSKIKSTAFLNAVVSILESEICDALRSFDRRAFVELCLRNHEKAQIVRSSWMNTARANLAIHRDKEAAKQVIAQRLSEINGATYPCRVLVEFALCECPLTGGMNAGQLDLSRLMALVNAILQLGGWSDAIHLDAMSPRLTITPFGEVRINTDFESGVLMPFYRKGTHNQIDSAADEYERNFVSRSAKKTTGGLIEDAFLQAWTHEFDCEFNEVRQFMDATENIGDELNAAVYPIRRSELINRMRGDLDERVVVKILRAFSFLPREDWRNLPTGFDVKDIQTWRFRRQLSALRRPILQIESNSDPLLEIAPGFIRECVGYVFRGYYEGAFHPRHTKSSQMRSWHDSQRRHRGSSFVELVAHRISETDGWSIGKMEMEVKEMIGTGRDSEFGDVRQFGDIDVHAWNKSQTRLLIIECKRLHFHKTAGEVAEQLSDYRGESRTKPSGKVVNDDLLKHTRRMEVLRARHDKMCNKLRINPDVRVEGWFVFKDPVPMLYSWMPFESQMQIATYDDIPNILAEK